MRDPNIMLDILRKRSIYNVQISNIYPLLYKKSLYSEDSAAVDNIIKDLRYERYRWNISQSKDVLLEGALYLILSTVYEQKFTDDSHGYRSSTSNRGCNTALVQVHHMARASEWFIKGIIVNLRDSIDTSKLLSIVSKEIHDNRVIELLRRYVKSNRFGQQDQYGRTYSGAPICKPLASLL